MATLNLGRIKPVFRGAYSGSTAYVVDDIVTHGNESFICIQAHGAGTQATSVTAYWTKLAAKGTDGTDVGATITTQGDILFRDGSGLQRLAKGTASQVLTMNSGATAPEWAEAAGGNAPSFHLSLQSNSSSLNSQTWYTIGGTNIACTEIFDTDSAVSSGIFTVPSGKAGTYLFGLLTTSVGSSSHGTSDGVFHRIEKSTDSGSSWACTPTNGEIKAAYEHSTGHEIVANSTHIAYNLSVGDQIRCQVYVYKGGSTNIVFNAGLTTGAGVGASGGTEVWGIKIG